MRPRLLAITDPAFGDDTIVRCVARVASALPTGALCVQLRDKRRAAVSLRVFAWRLREVTARWGAHFVVNGDPRLARDVGADGVHLGSAASTVEQARAAYGRGTWISVPAHSDHDVVRAVSAGADAALVSPVFASRPPSPTAPEKQGRGVAALASARRIAEGRTLVYALGGVDAANAAACIRAGADGVAVVRAWLAAPAPERTACALLRAIDRESPSR